MAGAEILPESTFFNRYRLRNKTIVIFIFLFWGDGGRGKREGSLGYKDVTTENTAQFLKYSPGAYIFQRPFFGGVYIRRGLCSEGNLRFKIDWASLILGRKFTVLLCFTAPGGKGTYIWRGDLSKGFCVTFYGTSYRVPRCLKCLWKMANSTASDNIAQWDELNSPLFQFYVN